MPRFYRRGEAFRVNPRVSNPDSTYAKSLPGVLQKKLEALPPPQKVTTLKEMSPEKQAAIRALYETRENKR